LGKFKKDGHYFEGDLLREEKPKLMVSAAYNINQKARRTSGQTGDLLYEARDMNTLLLDAIAKYNGWAFMTTYMRRDADNPITVNPLDVALTRPVFNGSGMDYQLSYCFSNKYELIGRYSIQKVASEIEAYSPDTYQFSFGINKYIWEHALKLQAEFTTEKQEFFDNTSKSNWYVRFQVEIGI
jgi:hypothetical protein